MPPSTDASGGRAATAALRRLARLHGVQPSYTDGVGVRQQVPDETLIAVLRALGAPLETPSDAAEALRAQQLAWWRTPVEPVVSAWQGRPAGFDIRGRVADLRGRLRCAVQLEDGQRREWTVDLDRPRRGRRARIDGAPVAVMRAELPRGLPLGYHTLQIALAGRNHEALVIVAPRRACDRGGHEWGVFLPTYALRTAESWGIGDFTDVERLLAWLGDLGGGMFSTLPLLAAFLGREPFDPSPYAPASRLFWNEVYVDPRRTVEFRASARAQALAGSASFGREVAALGQRRTIDYQRVMRLKRRVIELLAAEVAADDGARATAFRRFQRRRAEVGRYAAFRAAGEHLDRAWPDWPADLRDGLPDALPGDPAARRYHAYAQWVAAEQVASLAERAREAGPGLYLDVPIGVHPHGFDVWAYRDLFVAGVTAGAPRDALFTQGQNWNFPPLQPEAIRRDRYRYVRAALTHVAAQAGAVRLDHVMGLHRLYWIPDGSPSTGGAYVHYRPEEFYAVLTLESHRLRVPIIGENLGTVPPGVTRMMDTRGIRRMYVLQYAIRPAGARPVGPVPRRAVASLNTHDVPMFAAFLRGLDLDLSERLGWLTPGQVAGARRERARARRAVARALRAKAGATDADLLRQCLRRLARSGASLALVSLEDLWGETAPQNVPGTGLERANWRRRARYAFEQFRDRADVVETLETMAAERRRI